MKYLLKSHLIFSPFLNYAIRFVGRASTQLNALYLKTEKTENKLRHPFPTTKHLILGKNKYNYSKAYNLNVVQQISKLESFIFTIVVH